MSETVWTLRQQLPSGVVETIVQHTPQEEQHRPQTPCPTCARLWTARGPVPRGVETMVGTIKRARPYFYCLICREGTYPLDEALDVRAGRRQRDVQQAAVALATELPYEPASALLSRRSGMTVSSERRHTITHQVAADRRVVEGAPSREEIARRVGQVAPGRFRRPGLVLGMDGASVPSRPERARGRHAGREAKGCRLSLLDGERIVPGLSGHQGQTEEELGQALPPVKDAGVIPEDTGRLWVIGDGAEWIWKHGLAVFPHARQVLDYYPCAASLPKVAKAPYRDPLHAWQWVEAPLTRLYIGKAGRVLGGLRRMPPTSVDALNAIDHCWVYLKSHRGRTHYRLLRRGGYPLGSGGMASAHKFICPVRLQRSGAWGYEDRSNQRLALRCAKYNGTFAQVFTRHQHQKAGS